jgi:hypothetical protein
VLSQHLFRITKEKQEKQKKTVLQTEIYNRDFPDNFSTNMFGGKGVEDSGLAVLQSTEKTSVRIFELHTGIRSADF